MSAGALALAADPAVVEQAADPAEYVLQACERAKAWLQEVLEHGDIEQIAEIKSQAEAVRVYTMQKQLGKDAELSAAEIVRRAERGIGLAIRKGQESGCIRRQGQGGGQPPRSSRPRIDGTRSSPAEHAGEGQARADIYAMADGVPDESFEDALAEAKAEGNLSRSNVVRKIRTRRSPRAASEPAPEPADRSPAAVQARCELIGRCAAERMSSRQIAGLLGVSDQRVRELAREHGIEIPADAVVGRTRRLDSARIVRTAAETLEGLVTDIALASIAELDPADAAGWAASIARSARALSRFARKITQEVSP